MSSQKLQYAIRECPQQLDWQDIEVVDEDMGSCVAGAVTRSGFEGMVAEVGLGRVCTATARKDFFLNTGRTGSNEAEMKQAESRIATTIKRKDAQMEDGRTWLLGDYSLADICIVAVAIRLNHIGMSYLKSDRHHVEKYFARFQVRAGLQIVYYFGSLLYESYEDVNIHVAMN